MKVLLVADTSADDKCAAVQRLLVLKEGLESFGAHCDILYLGDFFLSSPRLLLPINLPSLLKLVKSYEIVHAAGVSTYVMGIAKPFASFTLICDVHGSFDEFRILRKGAFDFPNYYRTFLSMITLPVTLKQSDYFVACSRWLEQDLIRRGIDPKKIIVIKNGVDTDIFRPNGQRKSRRNSFTVTYAGAFQKWQGVENLLEAACALKSTDIRFTIIGFKNKHTALKERIRHRLGNRVELVDFLSQSELVRRLQNSDVFIIPRVRSLATVSAFPTKFAEYAAIGRPIIVTDVDETAELVKKYDCGFVCEPDASSLAKTILKAKETPSARLNQMGANGRRLAETKLSKKTIGEAYFNFLSWVKESGD